MTLGQIFGLLGLALVAALGFFGMWKGRDVKPSEGGGTEMPGTFLGGGDRQGS